MKNKNLVNEIVPWNISTDFLWEEQYMQNFNQLLKIKLIRYHKTKIKNRYDPKFETVKYLAPLDQKEQNKSWLIFNTAS